MKSCQEDLLWIVFRLEGEEYCIRSDYIDSIGVPAEVFKLPQAEEELVGVIKYNGEMAAIKDLRTILGFVSLDNYICRFGDMKDMHVAWVEELESCVKEKKEFLGAVDPHQCKFGQWYDYFRTQNHSLQFILNQITDPHERIHACGSRIRKLMKEEKWEDTAEVLREARAICFHEMIPMLDRLIKTYREVNRGALLFVEMEGEVTGLLVDEVTDLIPCYKTMRKDTKDIGANRYIRSIVTRDSQVILEVSVEEVLNRGKA